MVKRFSHKKKRLDRYKSFQVNYGDIIVVSHGIAVKENIVSKDTSYYDFYTTSGIIFNPNKDDNIVLRSIKEARINILDSKKVMDSLESDGLLQHFFLDQLSEELTGIKKQFNDQNLSGVERVKAFIVYMAELNKLAFNTKKLIIPKRMNNVEIANFCNCSRGYVSEIMNDLRKKNLIVLDDEGWIITDVEGILKH